MQRRKFSREFKTRCEILTQHFDLRKLTKGWVPLANYLERTRDDIGWDDAHCDRTQVQFVAIIGLSTGCYYVTERTAMVLAITAGSSCPRYCLAYGPQNGAAPSVRKSYFREDHFKGGQISYSTSKIRLSAIFILFLRVMAEMRVINPQSA